MTNLQSTFLRRTSSVIVLLLIALQLGLSGSIFAEDKVEVTGSIQAKTNTSITVNSIEFIVTGKTKIEGNMQGNLGFNLLKVGDFVRVEANKQGNAPLEATMIHLMDTKVNVEFTGAVQALTANSLKVKNTVVLVDSNTVIFTKNHTTVKLADLKIGDSVSVKATQKSDGSYLAITIELIVKDNHQEIEIDGKIQALTNTTVKVSDIIFNVDSSTIILSSAKVLIKFADLKIGNQVSVRGFCRPDSTYLATNIKVEAETFVQKELEVEGAITEINSKSFVVNKIKLSVDSSTVVYAHEGTLLNFTDLKVGDIVEVKAFMQQDSSFKAVRIRLENDESKKETEIEGVIEAVGTDNFTVGGLTIFVNSQTKIYDQNKQTLSFADLKIGVFVSVEASFQNNKYFASFVKVKDKNKTEINVTGPIENINGSSLTVSGTTFLTDQNTEFVDNNRNKITITDLKVGQIVSVKAVLQNGNKYYAVRIRTEDFWRSTITVEGSIDTLGINFIKVLGKAFFIDAKTVILGKGTGLIPFSSLTVGLKVEIKAKADSATGKLFAKLIKVDNDNEFEIFGKIESITGTQLVVAGITISTDNNTVYFDESDKAITFAGLKINQMVEVRYTKSGVGVNLALKIKIEKNSGSVVLNGLVTTASSNNLQLSLPAFIAISSNTVFLSSTFSPVLSSSIKVGQTVTVWANPDQSGNLTAVQVQQISGSITSVSDEGVNGLPVQFELNQNYPNPFNPTTNISFSLSKTENVSLKVYNVIGQEVASLVNGQMNSGLHVVTFNASRLTSGVYFYRLETGNQVAIKKMILLK